MIRATHMKMDCRYKGNIHMELKKRGKNSVITHRGLLKAKPYC